MYEVKIDPLASPEQRLENAGIGWAQYLHLQHLVDVRYISETDGGKWHRDDFQEGATGDGANLFVLVNDSRGTHAVKVGAGEFSPRTFLQDGSYYGHDEMPYASRLQKLTAATSIYVLEQNEGYFGLSPYLSPRTAQEFSDDPVDYLSRNARMVARVDGVDFNSRYYDHKRGESFTPGYANDYNGGMIELQPDNMVSIGIEQLESGLLVARATGVAAAAIAK